MPPSVVGDVHTGHAKVVGVSEVLLDKATWDRQTDRRIAALLTAAAPVWWVMYIQDTPKLSVSVKYSLTKPHGTDRQTDRQTDG